MKYAHACTFVISTMIGLFTGLQTANSQTVHTWRSDAANGYWADAGNWMGGAVPGGYDVVVLDSSAALMTNNLTGVQTNRHRIEFPNGSTARTIHGSIINSLAAVNGSTPAVHSQSENKQVLNFPLLLVSDAVITNGNNCDLVFSNTVDLKAKALRVDIAGDVTLAGVTRSSGGLLTKSGPGVLTLSGEANNVGLGATVEEGTLVLAKASGSGVQPVNGPVTVKGGTLRLGGTGGNQIPTGVSVSLEAGGSLDLGGLSELIDVVQGKGTITNSGGSLSTLTMGVPIETVTFGGSIVDGVSGGKLAFTKTGSGTVFLTGSNSYSGPTAINAGTLNVNTDGAGRGNYSIGVNFTLGVQRTSPAGSITIQNLSANTDGKVQLNLGAHGLPTVPTINAAAITTSAGSRLMFTGGIWETGMFPVLTYSLYDGGFGLPSTSLPPGVTAFLSNNVPTKTLLINLTKITKGFWTGAANSLWNTVHGNWRGTSDQTYSENTNGGYAVVFDDTLGTSSTNVQIAIVASPIDLQVNATNKNYSFSGTGRISGSPRMTKNGPGKLRIATSNDFGGDTFVHGGILEVANPSALGSTARGTIVTPGATLQLSNISVLPEALVISGEGFGSAGALRHVVGTSVWTGPIAITGAIARVAADAGMLRLGSQIDGPVSTLVLGGPAEIIVSNSIATFRLVKDGGGVVHLLGSNGFTDTVEVAAGTLRLDGTNAGGASLSIVAGGALAGSGLHNGSVEISGVISAGGGVGNLRTGSQFWNEGGIYAVDISAPIGTPGVDWDLLRIHGGIDIQAAPGSFIIKPVSRVGSASGPLAGFDNNSSYVWPIVELQDGMTNFTSAAIEIDTSDFSNDLAGGEFVIETNGTLNLRFTNNHPPVALDATFTRAPGTTMKIAVTELLGAFTSDADADDRELLSLGATANGGTLQRDGEWLLFTPNDDADDTFTYTVRDARNYRAGDTVRTATANISITKVRSAGTAQRIDATGGLISITFAGIPGFVYDVERSSDLGTWSVVATIVNPETGVFSFVDPDPPAQAAYYRLRQH